MNKSAQQIVARLLEYGIDSDAPRPGSADDPWRKGGHKKVDLKKMSFTGKRPGQATKADEKEKKEKAQPEKPDRFKWKPTSECLQSLLK